MFFTDRKDAGQRLAECMGFLRGTEDVVVLGIPRGGVVVAAQIARALGAPLDVFIAHKIAAPFNRELAIGALTSTGEVVIDADMVAFLRLSEEEIAREVQEQRKEIARRLALYRGNRPPLDVRGKTAVVADDGVATGATMLASLRALRSQAPRQLILAVPVGPRDTIKRLEKECDRLVALDTPESFWAVGNFYLRFEQTSDEQVIRLLEQSGSNENA